MDPLTSITGFGSVSATSFGWILPPGYGGGGYASASSQWALSGALLGGAPTGGGFATTGAWLGFSRTPVYQDAFSFFGGLGFTNRREATTTNRPGKLWDVWFDHKAGQKTERRSPLVLDLDGDRKPDITGRGVLGNDKIDGKTTLFDIDPRRDHWQYRSVRRRPGHGAPKVDGGHWENRDGRKLYVDGDGRIRGEMKTVDGKRMYHYGRREKREKTEWLARNGGDGLLVWDVDKDGKITSSRELFGEFDTKGRKRFQDGYAKLSEHFDRNRDGRVEGSELRGLKVWKDRDADGKVDKGEMRAATRHGITGIDVENVRRKDMSSTFDREKTTYQDVQDWFACFCGGWSRQLVGYQDSWSAGAWGGFGFW